MRILIADDRKDFAELLALMVLHAGHEIADVVTSGGLGAMRAYSKCAPDAVLMDFMMPHYNGVTATRQILSRDPGARVVLISGMPDTNELRWAAADAGAMGVLSKPFSQSQLEDLLAVLPFASFHLRVPVPEVRSPVCLDPQTGDKLVHSAS
jgi:CheY-like chemotaxis protein